MDNTEGFYGSAYASEFQWGLKGSYARVPKELIPTRGTLGYACYVAGKEYKKNHKKYF